MSDGLAGEALLSWNVAGLLADSYGSERTETVAGVSIDVGPDLRMAGPIDGRVRLQRTNRGILARADLETTLALECSRCLRAVRLPVGLRIDEEFLPRIDLATGRPAADDEPDVAHLTDHHELDLETAVREAILLAEPIAPLCRSDCLGLCIVCGRRLDDGVHDHPDDDIDPRLAILRGFHADDS